MKFPKELRILKRYEFAYLSRVGKRRHGTYFNIQYNAAAQKKIGITVSRKYGKAVARNRFKRLMREAFRTTDLPNIHLNVFPQKIALSAELTDIKNELINLTKQVTKSPE